MSYSFGQIEIKYGRKKPSIKRQKKKGYYKKLRNSIKDLNFVPVKNAFKGYQ